MTTPLNNKKGTTLVELMVCLVLLALFGWNQSPSV